jgi:hypothetical protein
LLAVAMLAADGTDDGQALREKLLAWRAARRDEVLAQRLEDDGVAAGVPELSLAEMHGVRVSALGVVTDEAEELPEVGL